MLAEPLDNDFPGPALFNHRAARLIFDVETEKSLLELMRTYELHDDEILWLGPRSVSLLAEGTFRGKLPDKLVLKKKELGVKRS